MLSVPSALCLCRERAGKREKERRVEGGGRGDRDSTRTRACTSEEVSVCMCE